MNNVLEVRIYDLKIELLAHGELPEDLSIRILECLEEAVKGINIIANSENAVRPVKDRVRLFQRWANQTLDFISERIAS